MKAIARALRLVVTTAGAALLASSAGGATAAASAAGGSTAAANAASGVTAAANAGGGMTVAAGAAGKTAAAATAAATTSATSSNWAGYVARGATDGRFTSVSGSWTEPAALCGAGHEAFSAVWVGLGGFRADATALEQIGTDADCAAGGRARYSSWVELLPAAPSALRLSTGPGERMTASVTVIGSHATLRLRNLTTGASYSTTRRLGAVDVSSAEWIVEAPSLCSARGCRTLPLAPFSTVSFSAATASSAGHTAAIGTSRWAATRLSLRQGGETAAPASFGPGGAASALITAIPTPAGAGGAFSVQFAERSGSAGASEAPTLPAGEPPSGA